MEEKKRSNVLTIVLFILLLIALGVICYLLGSNSVKDVNNKEIEEKENNSNEKEEEKNEITPVAYTPNCRNVNQPNLLVDIDENKYDNIVDYINEQKNIEITLYYCDDNPVTYDLEMSSYKLNNSEKTAVLNEIRNSEHFLSEDGLGGVCVAHMDINYERNGEKHEVGFYQLFALSSTDGNIYKILDKNLDSKDFCNYSFRNLSSTAASILDNLD